MVSGICSFFHQFIHGVFLCFHCILSGLACRFRQNLFSSIGTDGLSQLIVLCSQFFNGIVLCEQGSMILLGHCIEVAQSVLILGRCLIHILDDSTVCCQFLCIFKSGITEFVKSIGRFLCLGLEHGKKADNCSDGHQYYTEWIAGHSRFEAVESSSYGSCGSSP